MRTSAPPICSPRLTPESSGALDQLRGSDETTLTAKREVGRAKLPSTAIGLLFHAAERTQHHAGQALTTRRMLAGTTTG